MLHPELSLLVVSTPEGLIFLIIIINIFNKTYALPVPPQCGGDSVEEEVGLLSEAEGHIPLGISG